MFEYKVKNYFSVGETEREMNQLAYDGWRVISVVPDVTMAGYGTIVTFEREKEED